MSLTRFPRQLALGLGLATAACHEPAIFDVHTSLRAQVELVQGSGADSPDVGLLKIENCNGIGMNIVAKSITDEIDGSPLYFDRIWTHGEKADPYEKSLTNGADWGRVDLTLQYVHCGEPPSPGLRVHIPFTADELLESGRRLDRSEGIFVEIACFPSHGSWGEGEADPAPTDSGLDSGDSSSPISGLTITTGAFYDDRPHPDCEAVSVAY